MELISPKGSQFPFVLLQRNGISGVLVNFRDARGKDPPEVLLQIFFIVFGPKNACQAPKPSNPLPDNNIRVAYELHPTRYTGYRDQNKEAPWGVRHPPGLTCLDARFWT
jgi:hypothetical protein